MLTMHSEEWVRPWTCATRKRRAHQRVTETPSPGPGHGLEREEHAPAGAALLHDIARSAFRTGSCTTGPPDRGRVGGHASAPVTPIKCCLHPLFAPGPGYPLLPPRKWTAPAIPALAGVTFHSRRLFAVVMFGMPILRSALSVRLASGKSESPHWRPGWQNTSIRRLEFFLNCGGGICPWLGKEMSMS